MYRRLVSTAPSPPTPDAYIATLDEPRRSDVRRLHELVREHAPSLEARSEGGGIAYGRYRYRYANGREAEWPVMGLGSMKRYISFYLPPATPEHGYLAERARERLPKADVGRWCIRIKRLADVDLDVMAELIRIAANDDGAIIGPSDRSAG